MVVKLLVYYITLTIPLQVCQSARILGMISVPSYSHQVVFQPLWKELSLRGHQVTLLTTNPINDPTLTNLTEIDLSFSYSILHQEVSKIITSRWNPFKEVQMTFQTFSNVSNHQLRYPPVQKLINDPNVHFDLLIVEYIMALPLYLSRKLNCPYIGVFPTDPPNMFHAEFGNPAHPIVFPGALYDIYEPSTLLERVSLVLVDLMTWINRKFSDNYERELIIDLFRDDTPISAVRKNASVLLVNADPVFDVARPLLPNVIRIGGNVNRIPVQPLRKDVRKFLDEAKEGFIYFSLGSNVKGKDVPLSTLDVILNTFSELPYRVLWKCEFDLPQKSKNVFITSWVSQMEALFHPNLKLFITHGGAQSLDEAVLAKVPIVGMPFFVDQPFNIKKMVKKGCGLSVDYRKMSKEEFKSAILEVISDHRYRDRMQELSGLSADQPMNGLELAIWWVEYVIRHKGAKHLRSPSLDTPLYQYYYLDVMAILSAAFCILAYFICLFVKILRIILSAVIKLKRE